MEKIEADFNVSPSHYKALQSAEVIRLTDGKEYVRKDVASDIMAKYLAEYKEKLKKAVHDAIDDPEGIVDRDFIRAKAVYGLIDETHP